MRCRWLTSIPLLLAVGSQAGVHPAPWLDAVPRPGREPLVASLRKLVRAESRNDWHTVYELRPGLDRETESEAQFEQRWTQDVKATIIDFEPTHALPSIFGEESEGEKVFDILGCAKVRSGGSVRSQSGSVSAHLSNSAWLLDGVHLMTNSVDQPEPCTFHRGHGLLGSSK